MTLHLNFIHKQKVYRN